MQCNSIVCTYKQKILALLFTKEKYSSVVMPIKVKFETKVEIFHEFLFKFNIANRTHSFRMVEGK